MYDSFWEFLGSIEHRPPQNFDWWFIIIFPHIFPNEISSNAIKKGGAIPIVWTAPSLRNSLIGLPVAPNFCHWLLFFIFRFQQLGHCTDRTAILPRFQTSSGVSLDWKFVGTALMALMSLQLDWWRLWEEFLSREKLEMRSQTSPSAKLLDFTAFRACAPGKRRGLRGDGHLMSPGHHQLLAMVTGHPYLGSKNRGGYPQISWWILMFPLEMTLIGDDWGTRVHPPFSSFFHLCSDPFA